MTRLQMYRFEAAVAFDGGLIRAVEEGEHANAPLVDMLFVQRDADGGVLRVIDLATGRYDGTISALLDFRLDPGRREAATRRTRSAHAGGVPTAIIETLGASLAPGAAVLAVLVADRPPRALAGAVAENDGRLLADVPVAATTLADVVPELCAAL